MPDLKHETVRKGLPQAGWLFVSGNKYYAELDASDVVGRAGGWMGSARLYAHRDGLSTNEVQQRMESACDEQFTVEFDDGDVWTGTIGPLMTIHSSDPTPRVDVMLVDFEWTKPSTMVFQPSR